MGLRDLLRSMVDLVDGTAAPRPAANTPAAPSATDPRDDMRPSTVGPLPRSGTSAPPALPAEPTRICRVCGDPNDPTTAKPLSDFRVAPGGPGRTGVYHRHVCYACEVEERAERRRNTSSRVEVSREVEVSGASSPPPPSADRAVAESAKARRERELKAEHADLVERLQEARARAAVYERLASTPHVPQVQARERTSGLREGALVVLASDWHIEEVVEAEKVSGVNSYHLEVAEARARRFFEGVRWLLEHHRQAFSMRDVVLWFGGDLLTGYIHRELLETNELAPVEAVLWLKRVLSDGIATVLADPHLERLVIPWSNGNHDRTTDKRQVKTGAENSYGWLLGNVLRDAWAAEPRVQFAVDRSAHQYADIYGHGLHFTHGDELKYQGGVGGIGIPLLKRVPVWDRIRPAAYHHIGHFHQFRDFGRAVTNGSLIGPTEYSVSIGADLEPPQQASYALDARRGKTFVAPIWVGEGSPAAKTQAA